MIWKALEILVIILFWSCLIGGSVMCLWMLIEPMFRGRKCERN